MTDNTTVIMENITEPFNSDLFGKLCMGFGIPLVIVVVAWIAILAYLFNWLPGVYARQVLAHRLDATPTSQLVNIMLVLYWIFFCLPFAGFIGFGVTCMILLKPLVLGLWIAIAPSAVLLLFFGYQNYHANGYSMTTMFKICIVTCGVLIVGCTLLNTLLLDPISWMGAGFTLLWPPLFVFAGLLVVSHFRLSKKGISHALESQENMEAFTNNISQKHFENWTEGSSVFHWYYSLIVIIVSIVSNGGYALFFRNKPESQAATYTAGASFVVDVLLVASQFTLESQSSLFVYLIGAYVIKTVAVCFSRRFWFCGHGLIYFVVGSYFLTTALRGIWRRISLRRRNEFQDADEMSTQLASIDPIKKSVQFPEIILGGVCYIVLTIGIILEIYLTYSDSSFEVLPFGVTQLEIVIGCLILCACFSVSCAASVSFSQQRVSWVNIVFWAIPQLAVLIVSILWKGLDEIKGINYMIFPVYFLLFALFTSYDIFKCHDYQLQTKGNIFTNFFQGKYLLHEYFLISLILLTVIDVFVACVFPFFFVTSKAKCIGITFVCLIIAIAGFIAFCSTFLQMKEMTLPSIAWVILAVLGLAGFSLSLLPLGGLTWYIVAGVFLAIAALLVIGFALLWVKMCRWFVSFKQLLMITIPSALLSVFSIVVLINYEMDIPAALFSFIFVFIFFGFIIFYQLQRNGWRLNLNSIICIALLSVFAIGLVIWIFFDFGDLFTTLSVILLIAFVVSFITMLGIISARSTTDTVVFSNVFFPVRLYSRGELKTLSIFPYAFSISFLAPWFWGLIASCFFDYPQFGPLATSAAMVIIGFLAFWLIYDFDTTTMNSLQYISDDIIKFAIEKALRCNSIEVGQEAIERNPFDMSYEQFVEANQSQFNSNKNRSLFLSSVKAQLSISAEVAFRSALEELYMFFKSRNFECEFLRTETSWDVHQRSVVFSLIDTLHNINRESLAKEAEYLAFVQRQEEERARQMAKAITQNNDSAFAALVSELVRSKKKFDDNDFGPKKPKKCDSKLLSGCNYKRLEECYQALLGQYTLDDIEQGNLGDCYFIAALVAISSKPDVVRALFSEPVLTDQGCVCVNFWYFGKRVPVIVDTQLPFKNDKLRFSRVHTNGTPYWFTLVEKAFAKNAGSWSAIDGGNSHIALHRLTGGWPTYFSFSSLETKEMIASGELFDQLLKWHREGQFLCAGSASGEDTNKSKENIVLGHAYTILRVEEINGYQLLQIRNTWGHMEWNGDWGDDSPLWTPKMKELLNYRNADDGIFWMNFTDFTHQFLKVYACIRLDDWLKCEIDGSFEPDDTDGHKPILREKPAGVLPQWLVRFNEPTKLRCIFEKCGGASPCWIYMANNKGKKVNLIFAGTQYQQHPVAKCSELSSFEWHITNTNNPWTLLFCRNSVPERTAYHLTIYSDKPIEVTPIATTSQQPASQTV